VANEGQVVDMLPNIISKISSKAGGKRSMILPLVRWQSSLFPDPLPRDDGSFGPLPPGGPPPPPPPTPPSPPVDGQGSLLLPIRHSRKQLSTVITDIVELTEMAAEIIESHIGTLYTYDQHARDKKEATTRNTAWDIADVTVQKVESVMRGFAFLIPGTMWNRWLSSVQVEMIADIPASDILVLQQQILDRLIDEGDAYMSIRATRMEEMYGKKDVEKIKGKIDAKGNRIEEETPKTEEKKSDAEDDPNKEPEEDSYMWDFAHPGLTTGMFDTILDSIACTAAQTSDRAETLHLANHLHEHLMARHTNDGGDILNDNVHTRPTAVSFNALIRVVAELPYDNSVNISLATAPWEEVFYRDQAVTTFVSTIQIMHECDAVHRNSASFKYVLDCVAKYFPPCRIRGNISNGYFQQARYHGLVNDSVVASFIAANTPTNDEWNDAFIRDNLQSDQWPVKWKHDSRKLQYSTKDDVY
jgi:hypothetical protein